MSKRITWCLRFVSAAAILILFFYIFMDFKNTDNEAPTISTTNAVISVSVNDPVEALLQGVTAWDAVCGDVTDAIMIESVYAITKDGYATVTYAVSDRSGNTAKKERIVHYTDYTSPRIFLSGPLVFEFGTHFDVLDYTIADDIFEGDISRRIKPTMLSTGTSVSEEGKHEVQFRVTNSMGDTTQLVLPVEVYPVGSYNAKLMLSEYLVYLPAGAAFEEADYLIQIQIRDYVLDLNGSVPGNVEMRISGEVDSSKPGVYPVTYTAIVQHDGLIYTGYTTLLVVVEG